MVISDELINISALSRARATVAKVIVEMSIK